MSDGIIPVQPVSRIEPINRVFGPDEMDPGLYQTVAASLCTLFQKRCSSEMSSPLNLPLIAVIDAMQPKSQYGRKKKYSKKGKRDLYKITAFFKNIFDQDN